MLILATDITVSISLSSPRAIKYITIKRLQCVKVGKSQTHKLQNISQSIPMIQVFKISLQLPKQFLSLRFEFRMAIQVKHLNTKLSSLLPNPAV